MSHAVTSARGTHSRKRPFRLLWLVPIPSILLGVFILTASQIRQQAIETASRRNLEQRVSLVSHVVQRRAQHCDERALLDDAQGLNVLYLSLQNEDRILSSSPSAPRSSHGDADPSLAAAENSDGVVLRRTLFRGREIFEGLAPIVLSAEATAPTALLRVGIDPATSGDSGTELAPRSWIVVILASVLIMLSVFVTWLLRSAERRRYEAETEMADREAENRHWQMIGQMAATVAHEVRNPVNAITMAAQRLEKEFEIPEADEEEYRELTGVLRSEAGRVGKVVNDFLDLGRPLDLKIDRVSGEEALSWATIPLMLRAEQEEKHLLCETEYDGDLHVDKQRFTQVVSNLVSNALDAADEGGTVRVSLVGRAGGAEVIVEDNGCGMVAEILAEALEPFVTNKARGIGLGLPLAARLVKAHGGSLELTSSPNEGTVAKALFPVSSDSSK